MPGPGLAPYLGYSDEVASHSHSERTPDTEKGQFEKPTVTVLLTITITLGKEVDFLLRVIS